MAHYLLYGRVSPKGSTWSATETSIPDQLRDGRAYVLARDPAATFTEAWDEFASANHARMPAFQRALAELRSGTAPWQAIVFRHIDRIGRSAVEVIQFGAELAAHGRYFIAYAMPFPTEPPIGPLVLGIFALLAEFERRMLSDRTRSRMVGIASQGGLPYGRAPYGYRRAAKHDNRVVPDPERAPRVLAIFQAYADGTPLATVCRQHSLSRQSVLNILRRRTYLGLVTYAGHEYPGAHPPLVTPDLHAAVQTRLAATTPPGAPAIRPGASPRSYPLCGLLHCTCGRSLTAGSGRGRLGKVYRYYQCTDHDCRRRVPADQLESQVFLALRSLPVRPAVIDRALQLFAERLQAQLAGPDTAAEQRLLETDRADLDRQRQRLVALFLDGTVDGRNAAEFNGLLSDCRDRLAAIDARLALLRSLSHPSPAVLADATAWARTFRDLSARLEDLRDDPQSLAAMLRAVVDRVDLRPDASGGPKSWTLVLRLPGSSEAVEWQRTVAVGEPFHLVTIGDVAVVVRLVAA